jgi:hypothetical protein
MHMQLQPSSSPTLSMPRHICDVLDGVQHRHRQPHEGCRDPPVAPPPSRSPCRLQGLLLLMMCALP